MGGRQLCRTTLVVRCVQATIGQLDYGRYLECVQWQAQMCYDSCLFFKDVLTPPTKREVVGLNLPVFDREMDARRPPNRIWD